MQPGSYASRACVEACSTTHGLAFLRVLMAFRFRLEGVAEYGLVKLLQEVTEHLAGGEDIKNFQKSTSEHNLRAERCELCWSGKGLYFANGIGRKALLEMVCFERVPQDLRHSTQL